MDLIGIKIKDKDKAVDCIKILRKFSEMSVGEIKEKIQSGDFVFECSYTDSDGLAQVISLYREFSAAEIEAEIFEHGRLTDIDFLENLLNTYKEIDEENYDQ